MLTNYWKRTWRDLPRMLPDVSKLSGGGLIPVILVWACCGAWWRDKKGYHARASSRNKAPLVIIQVALGGKLNFRPSWSGGYWQWTVTRKATVEWLDRQMTALFLPGLPEPDRSVCRHCGMEDGYHDQECQDAPGE